MSRPANPWGQFLVILFLSPVFLLIGCVWVCLWMLYAIGYLFLVLPVALLFPKQQEEVITVKRDRDL